MRIIGGERKGHAIYAPKGLETRPTSDRVRENVFNIVSPWVEGARVGEGAPYRLLAAAVIAQATHISASDATPAWDWR